jgi:HlyD family secretion protein
VKKKLLFWIVLIVLLGAAAFGYVYFYMGKEATLRYRTAPVQRGNLATYVTANGTVNPVITVLVGSQVSGTIQKLYADYNSMVKEGQLIAQIDPALFQAQLSQAKAKLENSRAASLTAQADIATARSNVEASKANVIKAQVAVDDTKRNLNRSVELFQRNLISASDRDTAQSNYDSAVAQIEAARAQQKATDAQVDSAKARLEAARAQIKQSEAELELAQVNIDHTKILAPVNGIVISRNVDVGQTVAASLQAPTLFTIAQDLTEMQVDTNVSEADVGRVAVGQETTFTVDAFPQITFKGKVTEIRNAPQTIQNVVTYDVIVQVKNPGLRLRPGMTANVSVLVAHKEEVLKIPNAALRFRPEFAKREASATPPKAPSASPSASLPSSPSLERLRTELNLTPEQQASLSRILADVQKEKGKAQKGTPEPGKAKGQDLQGATRSKVRALLNEEQKKKYDQMIQGRGEIQAPTPLYKVWTPVPQGRPVPVEITTGISDGSFTEVISGPLKEGQEIILEAIGANNKASSSPQPSMKGLR